MSNPIGFVLANFFWFADLILSLPERALWAKLLHGDFFAIVAVVGGVGIFTFALGVIQSLRQGSGRPYAILASALLSIVVVGLSAAYRGKLDAQLTSTILLVATALQIAILIGAILWARNGRVATLLMTPLVVSFWLNSAFSATMSFTDTWL